MGYQTVFKRYELKYIMTREQKAKVLKAMEPYMTADKFGRSTIRNIYFDSDDYILARHSIAKPDFKEKLRIRSYSLASSDSTVFVELKRKADHLVYKRRVALPEKAAMSWTGKFDGSSHPESTCGSGFSPEPEAGSPVSAQMSREIDYFLSYYGNLRPAAFLSYERQAYKMRDSGHELNDNGGHDQDFRVTFDENILFRGYDLSLTSDVYGKPVLDSGMVLMELKCSGGIPLWMVKVLSEEHIYKTSFSKYGTAYSLYIQPELCSRAAAKALAEAPSVRERQAVRSNRSRFGRSDRPRPSLSVPHILGA